MCPTEADVTRHITKAEMILHCRRTIQDGEEVMLKQLTEAYDGERSCNTFVVPLIHSARMPEIWKALRKKIPALSMKGSYGLHFLLNPVF